MMQGYQSTSGQFEAVYVLEIQVPPDKADRVLDAVMEVHPLTYGRYRRNASISAVGRETAQPEPGSTTTTHLDGFIAGTTQTYPMVELKISIPRDLDVLDSVMTAVLNIHHYEQPVIYLREDWASRAAYDPDNTNPNRWWNSGEGLPDALEAET